MRIALMIAISAGAIATVVAAWRLSDILSHDAIGMAIGMALGVLAGVPTLALVAMARRRDEQDEYADAQPPIDVYADEVTPYSRIARRVAGLPQLPDRQTEIETLRMALAYLENEAQ